MRSTADITPKPAMLDAEEARHLEFDVILGELCDNPFDADARQVVIAWRPKQLLITDDGRGCEDIRRFFTFGDHGPSVLPGGGVGMYGQGTKAAWANLSQVMTVRTVYQGTLRTATADRRVLKARGWSLEVDEEPTTEKGTIVRFTEVSRQPRDHAKLVEKLGFRYAPALRQGRQIRYFVRTQQGDERQWHVEPYTPPRTAMTSSEVSLPDGRRAQVRLGLVPEEVESKYCWFQVGYKYRNILQNADLGLGDRLPENLYGEVDCVVGFKPNTNKTNLLGLPALGRAILLHPAFRALFEEAERRQHAILIDRVEEKVNELLDDIPVEVLGAKERRIWSGGGGGARPGGTGAARRRGLRAVQPGDQPHPDGELFPGQRKGLLLRFWRKGEDGLPFEVQLAARRVLLNEQHPWIAALRHDAHRVYDVVLMAYLEAVAVNTGSANQMTESQRGDHVKFYARQVGLATAASARRTNVIDLQTRQVADAEQG
jgi:hypothetical protein